MGRREPPPIPALEELAAFDRDLAPGFRLLSPPGAGPSRLARHCTTILPAMTLAEALETTRIHRVAGLTDGRTALVTSRPCRAPHQTISAVGLIGGAGADAGQRFPALSHPTAAAERPLRCDDAVLPILQV
jgi:predicted ATPase with chaperone activity